MACVYVLTRGLGDSSNAPETEILGVFSTPEAAETAMLREAPNSGSVDRYQVDESGAADSVMWREWDHRATESVTRRA